MWSAEESLSMKAVMSSAYRLIQAHSWQNSSIQDVTQAVSRTFYVMDTKQQPGFFFHDSQFFYTLWKY